MVRLIAFPAKVFLSRRNLMSRYNLTDFEWRVIEPLLANKPRGVPRVDDRAKGMGQHPAQGQPQGPDLFQSLQPKQFRRIATRYDKLAENYLAVVNLVAIRIWLRSNESTA